MANLQAIGVTMLASFLTPNELSILELENEPTAAEAAGIKFLSFPINDLSTSNPETYRELLKTAQTELGRGGHVVGHCRMGIGRASMFAAAVLITEGVSLDKAWKTVARARGLAVPDTGRNMSTLIGQLWSINY